jgi:hypothetical protein
METLTIENEEFREVFEEALNKYCILYSKSKQHFLQLFSKNTKDYQLEFKRLLNEYKKYENTELEDLAQFSNEVYHYYLLNKPKKENKPKYQPFTLRSTEELKTFNSFLDKMIKLLELSPGHFVKLFPECPIEYWDKIDDLRETSIKYERDAPEFISCLEKCKRLSFSYFSFVEETVNNTKW